ncbi:MAG: endonuclease [Pseudomonadota bacterium]
MNRFLYALAALGLLLALYLVEQRSDNKLATTPEGSQDISRTETSLAGNRIKDYATARPVFWKSVYPDGGVTLYCRERFASRSRSGINIEHVFPMSWVKNALDCGTRKQCQGNSTQFNLIEADLHNLYPARTDVNHDRASFRFAEVAGEPRHYGVACDFEVDSRARIVEPAPQVRGDVARAMFYMADRYQAQGLTIFARSGRLLHEWHLADPPDEQERLRNQRIEQIQGNRNRFVDEPDELSRLVRAGHFF